MATFKEWWGGRVDDIEDAPRTEGANYNKTTHRWAWDAALESRWQPIETAPKDDEEFLGWQKGLGVSVVRWNDDFGCFVTENDCGEVQSTVTHWMPLPKPPEGE